LIAARGGLRLVQRRVAALRRAVVAEVEDMNRLIYHILRGGVVVSVAVLVFGFVLVASGLVADRGRRALRIAVIFLVAQLPWLIPGIFTLGAAGPLSNPRHYATQASVPFGVLRVFAGGSLVGDMPVEALVDECPLYDLEPEPPHAPLYPAPAPQLADHPTGPEAILALLRSSNVASKRWAFQQYDPLVGSRTVRRPEAADAAVLALDCDGGTGALAVSIDCNGRRVACDPYTGTVEAVLECARNLACVGAEPLGLTNCLNFANPELNEVYWDLHEAIQGIADACTALGIPVVSGNVSLYNESERARIDPTVVIGMVGVLEDVERACSAGFARRGDRIAIVGPVEGSLDATELQRLAFGINQKMAPELDLDLERRVHGFVHDAIEASLLHTAHDCAEGGLAVALAESSLWGGIGVRVDLDIAGEERPWGRPRVDGILFGESQSRFLISFAMEASVQLRELADRHSLPLQEIGVVGGDRIVIDGAMDVALAAARRAYKGALVGGE